MATSKDRNRGSLGSLLQGLGRKPNAPRAEKAQPQQRYPYQLRDFFLSPAEIVFYKALSSVAPSNIAIFPKIRLADVVSINRSASPYASEARLYFSKIIQKHIDFLLCQADTLTPLVGIELEDSSRQESGRTEHDEFMEGVFEAANLPLVRFPAQSNYDSGEITRLLSPFWESPTPPRCPKCDKPMLIRTAKSGEYQGVKFYVCPDTKYCRTYFPVRST
ncbi:MAG: DUF2726 domain-containing protein [Chloroflexi bacterium]|nr:DUF2726 domain-containing protein [Chloroflexota bacterium]